MKQTFIFVLGRNAALSVAEILAVLTVNKWDFEIVLQTSEVLLVDSSSLDYKILNKTLGGTVKIGVVCGVSPLESISEVLDVKFLTEKIFAQTEHKIQFGISVYDGGDYKQVERVDAQIESLYKRIKKELSVYSYSVRFAFQKDRYLSSVVVSKNKMIEKGAEVLLIPTPDGVVIGKTLCVQEFEEFSARDYGRPVRDMKSGVMPPKLARMMINLAQISKDAVLLDAFCGSGTVLQEAAILGYKHIYGRDVSQKAVNDSKQNAKWLFESMPELETQIDIEKCDVTNLAGNLGEKVAAVVSEPYLGPTLHQELPHLEFERLTYELEKLYIGAFKEFAKILSSRGVVVFILPVFQRRRQKAYMEILSKIENLGFKKQVLEENSRGGITIGNRYDFVLREIVKFEKLS